MPPTIEFTLINKHPAGRLVKRAALYANLAQSVWVRIKEPLSLAPNKNHASAPLEILSAIGIDQLPTASQVQYCKGMAQALDAMLHHFPENIFWDIDGLCACILNDARRSLRPLDIAISERFELVKELMQQFGGESPISFRYVHDFTYGFDWSRWAKRSPGYADQKIPFNLAFLRYLQQRSYEIVELISDNDQDYPKLAPGEKRNPFTFSREPEDEKKLYNELALKKLIPVPNWNVDAIGLYQIDYLQQRRLMAEKLGIGNKDCK